MRQYDPIEWAHPDELPAGMYLNVPDEVYHSLPYASFHRLLPVLRGRTWSHYRAALDEPDNPTEAMLIGRGLHLAALQPEVYRDTVIDGPINPKTGQGYNLGTAKVTEAQEQMPEALVLPPQDRRRVEFMALQVRQHPVAKLFLEAAGAYCYETTGIVDYETQHGVVRCQFRPDIWIPEEQSIADLKSTEDASESSFSRDIGKYYYHCQASMYLEMSYALGYPADSFTFLAVEKEAACWTPSGVVHGVAAHMLGEDSVDSGRSLIRGALAGLAQCQARDEWPAYSTKLDYIEAPTWALGGYNG